jgi:hypothetical protein
MTEGRSIQMDRQREHQRYRAARCLVRSSMGSHPHSGHGLLSVVTAGLLMNNSALCAQKSDLPG